jgi:pimeloyl-ACP methyl ester carboxylesterase
MITLSSGVRVRVAERGARDAPPVLMLHGWGASLYMYRHAFATLPAYGVRVIAVDLRGYGLSDKPLARGSYTMDAYSRDIDALLEALALERTAMIGHSMGGGLALRYALRRPSAVRRLVLLNPAGLVPIPYARLLGAAPRALSQVLGARLVPRSLVGFILRRIAYADPSLVTERDVDEYWAPTQLPGFEYAAHAGLQEFDWRPISAAESTAMTVSSLVFLGTHDRLVRDARAAAERLCGSTVHEIDGGHSVHEEHPEQVYDLIGAFVR